MRRVAIAISLLTSFALTAQADNAPLPCFEAAVSIAKATAGVPSNVHVRVKTGSGAASLGQAQSSGGGQYDVFLFPDNIDSLLGPGAQCDPAVLVIIILHELLHIENFATGAETAGDPCAEYQHKLIDLANLAQLIAMCSEPGAEETKKHLCEMWCVLSEWIGAHLVGLALACGVVTGIPDPCPDC